MKRVAIGIVWFVALWFGTLVVGSSIAGGIAGSKVNAVSGADGYTKGQVAGRNAGAEFGRNYGSIILFGAALIAIGGTIAGILPGTKRKQD